MTATDELRKLLEEHGIKHFDYDKGGRTQTQWAAPDGTRYFSYETYNNPSKTAKLVISWFPTPEQAIAATLGNDAKLCYATDYTHARCKYSVNRGWTEDTKFYVPTLRMLTAEQVREAIEVYSWAETRSIREFNDSSWQAIADELNATLRQRMCRLEETESYQSDRGIVHVLECSNCGQECEHVNGDYEYCPHCLARNTLF